LPIKPVEKFWGRVYVAVRHGVLLSEYVMFSGGGVFPSFSRHV